MSSYHKALYASRFMRPPTYWKRLKMREKPRQNVGAYEHPARRFVRLREKAREFAEIPEARLIPMLKPDKPPTIQEVEDLPTVSPAALEARLEFLLSEKAIQQQVNAPLREGQDPHYAEFLVWEDQLREIRKIYRAQYLYKLAEVTNAERDLELKQASADFEAREDRRQEARRRRTQELNRRAILKDRLRIEETVEEHMELQTRVRTRDRQLRNLKQMPLGQLPNLEEAADAEGSDALLNRNVSTGFLLRQTQMATAFPPKNDRPDFVDNVYREVKEASYDLLDEDEDDILENRPSGDQVFSSEEIQLKPRFDHLDFQAKVELLTDKIALLENQRALEESRGEPEKTTILLLDQLMATKLALEEEGHLQAAHQKVRDTRAASLKKVQSLKENST